MGSHNVDELEMSVYRISYTVRLFQRMLMPSSCNFRHSLKNWNLKNIYIIYIQMIVMPSTYLDWYRKD